MQICLFHFCRNDFSLVPGKSDYWQLCVAHDHKSGIVLHDDSVSIQFVEDPKFDQKAQ